jgi:hypothetical protein
MRLRRQAAANPQTLRRYIAAKGYFASMQMDLLIFLSSSAHLPSVFLLLRQRRIATYNGLDTGLVTTIKYLRRATSSAPGNGLGTTIKYL